MTIFGNKDEWFLMRIDLHRRLQEAYKMNPENIHLEDIFYQFDMEFPELEEDVKRKLAIWIDLLEKEISHRQRKIKEYQSQLDEII